MRSKSAELLMRVAYEAYRLGFMKSGEGYNGEIARDNGVDLEQDGPWSSNRDAALSDMVNQDKEMQEVFAS